MTAQEKAKLAEQKKDQGAPSARTAKKKSRAGAACGLPLSARTVRDATRHLTRLKNAIVASAVKQWGGIIDPQDFGSRDLGSARHTAAIRELLEEHRIEVHPTIRGCYVVIGGAGFSDGGDRFGEEPGDTRHPPDSEGW